MRPSVAAFALVLVAFAPLVVPGPVAAQSADGWTRCGDPNLVLIFKNPDLQIASDGRIHASGFFFIQFQAIGERALDITKFAFSFGKPVPAEAHRCDLGPDNTVIGPHLTGAYIYKYRSDDNPNDGFFVPINTTNVPDGEYAAMVSAFDASGREIVRYYANAIVENGCPLGYRACNADTIRQNDKIKPWPIVLPGDGEQTHPSGGLTIEFGEYLAEDPIVTITPHLGIAQRVPLQVVESRMYDDDAIPDNPLAPSAVQARVWGPTYQWNGVIRNEDIIRVQAVDLNGNRVDKILHIGDPTIGGRIVLAYPDLEITGSGQERTADPSGKAVFPFQFKNVGNGSAHGNLLLDALPEGIRAKFDRDHVVNAPNQIHFANLTVTAGREAKPGTYEIKGIARYQRAATEVQKDFSVRFVLSSAPTNATTDQDLVVRGSRPDETLRPEEEPLKKAVEEDTGPTEKGGFLGLPAPGALPALLAVGAAAALAAGARRR